MTDATTSLDRTSVPVEGDLRLPRPPGVIRRYWYRHPRLADALVAVAYLLPTVLGSLLASVGTVDIDPALLPVGFALVLFGGIVLLFRRSRPLIVLVTAWVLTLLSAPVWQIVDYALVPFALYALAVYGSTRAAWIGFGGSVLVGLVAGSLAMLASRGASDALARGANVGIAFAVVVLIVVLIGVNIGNRRRYVVALLDRAEQLARERDQQAQLAAIAERARIAREMHDIVSHGLTVMVTLAEGSAASLDRNPERAAEAMRHVAETGRQALGDMRRMLGVLDDGLPADSAGALEPQPGIAQLDGLIEGFRTAGLAVRFTSEGSPPRNPAEQLTVYRLVQESLTNVLRHSTALASVSVTVEYGPDEVRIAVSNTGAVVDAPAAASGGHGIVGMRERVALYGGTVESGPRAGGGWSVVATLRHDHDGTAAPE
jgi:signal transduction histidine kinase